MSKMNDYESYDATGLAELVRRGEVSPLELLDAAIERVEARNPLYNAVVNRLYDEAKRDIQRGLPEGPFQGVPFLLKDLGVCYKGVPTTYGSRLYADFIPDHDSTLLTRYRRAGLVIFGKTNTPEFGLTVTTEPRLFGPTRNPWDTERTSGGSSGGSAAAVACGMVPAAHASDGGGSIRIPASCCGLFGLKPTRGRVPHGPDVGEGWNGMSIDHVITRSVRDSAGLLDATAGPAPGDPYWAPPVSGPFSEEVGKDPGRLKIALTTTPPGGGEVDPECIAAAHLAAEWCTELGHGVEEAAPSIDYESFKPAYVTVINANIRAMLEIRGAQRGREASSEEVERITWLAAEAGRKVTAPAYVRAVQTIHRTGRRVAEFFERYDITLSPVLLTPPVPLGYLHMDQEARVYAKNLYSFFGFTNLFNATGQPSMSVPLHWTAGGLPVGVLFSASFGNEALLLRLASQLEEAHPWKDRRPGK